MLAQQPPTGCWESNNVSLHQTQCGSVLDLRHSGETAENIVITLYIEIGNIRTNRGCVGCLRAAQGSAVSVFHSLLGTTSSS